MDNRSTEGMDRFCVCSNADGTPIGISDEDFGYDVLFNISGDFGTDAEKIEYLRVAAKALNAAASKIPTGPQADREWPDPPPGARDEDDAPELTADDFKRPSAKWNAPEPRDGHGWTCVTERLPTEAELKAGVLFGIHWPEGRVEMVSWDMEYQHDYELMCRHFEVFQPDRSSGTGYWRTSASIAPPRSGLTKGDKP